MTRNAPPGRLRRRLALLPLAALIFGCIGAAPAADPAARGLERLLAAPGSRFRDDAAALKPDYFLDFDRRLPLDTVVHVLEHGARCRRVLVGDSLWAVDYTWVYPHRGLPGRWYDVDDLIRVGDSLGLGDDADVVVTFGTLRTGVRAGSLERARLAAGRARPRTLPEPFLGRLKLKLERARKSLSGETAN